MTYQEMENALDAAQRATDSAQRLSENKDKIIKDLAARVEELTALAQSRERERVYAVYQREAFRKALLALCASSFAFEEDHCA